MRIFSDNAVTKSDLVEVDEKLNATDILQDKQIKELRVLLAVAFLVNVALSIALKYFS
jgi:hypothetical protein